MTSDTDTPQDGSPPAAVDEKDLRGCEPHFLGITAGLRQTARRGAGQIPAKEPRGHAGLSVREDAEASSLPVLLSSPFTVDVRLRCRANRTPQQLIDSTEKRASSDADYNEQRFVANMAT
ncbi:hypothetical protein B0H14DRAFT_2600906 [Mycena olivaceomarginata]|nr:hypothetical protein B0H14DRAFT_2600906 [Mycena olivaceomarginata]